MTRATREVVNSGIMRGSAQPKRVAKPSAKPRVLQRSLGRTSGVRKPGGSMGLGTANEVLES